jgi:beta-mannosidase
MKKIELNGTWQFKAVDKYRTLPEQITGITEWMNGTVPGTVHTDLLANGKIPDPFYRMNEQQVQWIDSQQWLYRREFEIDEDFVREKRVELVAEGLDTYAHIRINGIPVAITANMFVEHQFDVKRFLRPGKNIIEIIFDSPTVRSKALERKYGMLQVANNSHRAYVRKAQYSFGWDWGPCLTTSGIWRDIRLEAYTRVILHAPFVKVISVTKAEAVLELSINVSRFTSEPLQLRTIIWDEKAVVTDQRRVNAKRMKFRIRIKKPGIWWPNGYGDQPMYRASFSVVLKDEEIEHLEIPFAIRTVRLLQEPDKEGTSFIIEINGEKIFCKGADWIPSDSFIPRIPSQTYEKLLSMAKTANMNMLRVWAGGIYEQEVFYELCDRYGLMVWQDFMFACGEYPEVPWFLNQVKDEAEKAVTRLRNHPSIVLWCGNNECEWNFCKENPGRSPDEMNGSKIFKAILPSICNEFDGTRPYWRSSPFGKGLPNDESNGNHHQWTMWGEWKDYKEYENDNARFVTEFGFQAPPQLRTLESVTILSDRHPQSQVLEHHNKLPEGTERLFRFQSGHVNVGTDLDDFIYKGQIVQAEALKTAVEHWRQRKFKTAGSLFWQLNDCWPVTSWSVIDSALRPKAAYYYAKKFFAPALVSFRYTGKRLEVWGTSDLLEPLNAELEVTLHSFDGSALWSKVTHVIVGRNASKILMHIDLSEWSHVDPAQSYFLAHLKKDDVLLAENRYFFVEPKHMVNRPSRVVFELEKEADNVYSITLTSTTLEKNIRIEIENEDAELSDNYFDVDAGIPKLVRIISHLPQELIKERLRLRAL